MKIANNIWLRSNGKAVLNVVNVDIKGLRPGKISYVLAISARTKNRLPQIRFFTRSSLASARPFSSFLRWAPVPRAFRPVTLPSVSALPKKQLICLCTSFERQWGFFTSFPKWKEMSLCRCRLYLYSLQSQTKNKFDR